MDLLFFLSCQTHQATASDPPFFLSPRDSIIDIDDVMMLIKILDEQQQNEMKMNKM